MELAPSVVHHSPTEFLMNVIHILLALYSAKYSSIHLWGTELQAYL